MSAASPAPTRRERKQRATREGLLTAALSLFAERGYENTTMDDIAMKADVARATAFNYYRHKEDFLLAWAERRRTVMADLAGSGTGRGSLIRRLASP